MRQHAGTTLRRSTPGGFPPGAGKAAPRRRPSAAAAPVRSGRWNGRPARQSAIRGLEPAPHDLPDTRGELGEVRHRHDDALPLPGLPEVRESGGDRAERLRPVRRVLRGAAYRHPGTGPVAAVEPELDDVGVELTERTRLLDGLRPGELGQVLLPAAGQLLARPPDGRRHPRGPRLVFLDLP